ncbi:hypothetical protein SPRG_05375 [Saprolegnia parasitica CBS 223.65]|uniref:Uncharacterized protein n=1 Tax=Saprolegnia parasitica (strain CBS 223.65) TaxID=695850 RepID=A0A067CI80_SAPPC|nr:hypothetical protein SPRG_05375 [Saprolegnia parasitica CBS 223.65]KDO30183.1 hypothetical protein SPRG_05375 [Saprolegnia parasitica CBS 223.65]|eukprot:XP_012199361.1 hypothetical protein SPRG_05375 [Saprolegnia parasitica CBS 223.65]
MMRRLKGADYRHPPRKAMDKASDGSATSRLQVEPQKHALKVPSSISTKEETALYRE